MKNKLIGLSLFLFLIYIISLCLQTDLFTNNLSTLTSDIRGTILLWIAVIWFMFIVLNYIYKPKLLLIASILFNIIPYGHHPFIQDLHVIFVYIAIIIYSYVLFKHVIEISYINHKIFLKLIKLIIIASSFIVLIIGKYGIINGFVEIIYVISYLLILYIGNKK